MFLGMVGAFQILNSLFGRAPIELQEVFGGHLQFRPDIQTSQRL